MQKMQKNKRNIIIIINCILSLGLLIISGTLAAYTSTSSVKRTVSTVGSAQLFSSNVLTPYSKEDDILGKAMPFSSGNETNSFYLSICNYKQGDKTKWAATDISYILKISLVDTEGNNVTDETILSKYSCDYNNNSKTFKDLETTTINDTLSKNSASENLYKITVPTKYMKSYRIKITAESEGYQPLGRYISAAEEATSSQWKLSFLNDEKAQAAFNLGCINTKLTGSEHATLKLSWNPKHVDIDPWFLNDNKLTVVKEKNENNETISKYISFEAGEENSPNQYNIIFYRTNSVRSDDKTPETWTDIEGYITLTSTPISK